MSEDNKYVTKRKRILNAHDKLMEECTNSLAKLWRIILRDLNVEEKDWKTLMDLYLTDPLNGFNNDKKLIGDKSGNLNSALCYTNMQHMIFIRALRFLQVTTAIYKFTLHFKDSDPEEFSITVDYGNKEGFQIKSVMEEDKDSVKKEVVQRRRFVSTFKKQPVDVINKYTGDFTLEEWLADPNKKIGNATGILSKIWRRILARRDVTKDKWKQLTVEYQKKVIPEAFIVKENETPAEKKSRTKKRSNVQVNVKDELSRPSFTINVFMKGMVFLDVEKVDICLKLKRVNSDRLSTHELIGWDPIRDFLKHKK